MVKLFWRVSCQQVMEQISVDRKVPCRAKCQKAAVCLAWLFTNLGVPKYCPLSSGHLKYALSPLVGAWNLRYIPRIATPGLFSDKLCSMWWFCLHVFLFYALDYMEDRILHRFLFSNCYGFCILLCVLVVLFRHDFFSSIFVHISRK